MEYTFKNTMAERVQTIILNQSYLVVQSIDKEEQIPYTEIESVKLSRSNGKVFRITLKPRERKQIVVTNKYFLPDGACEDRSRQYTAFVRVLHYHLREKASPIYSLGFSSNLLIAWALTSAFAAFFISFVSEYLGLTLINPFLQGIILTVVIVLALFVINRGKMPKTYSPSDIPFSLLP